MGRPGRAEQAFRRTPRAARIQSHSAVGGIDEKIAIVDGAFRSGADAVRPGGAATGGCRPALYAGVLLQGAMGASAGISATFPEEPLPAAAEDRRKRAH